MPCVADMMDLTMDMKVMKDLSMELAAVFVRRRQLSEGMPSSCDGMPPKQQQHFLQDYVDEHFSQHSVDPRAPVATEGGHPGPSALRCPGRQPIREHHRPRADSGLPPGSPRHIRI